jgi:hypothetical protein
MVYFANVSIEKPELANNQPPSSQDELEAIAKWIIESKPVAEVSNDAIQVKKKDTVGGAKKAFLQAIDEYFCEKGLKTIQRGDWIVQITRSGIVSSLEHGYRREKINAFTALPQIIQSGKIIQENKKWKNRRYDSFIIDAPLTIGEKEYVGEVIINHHQDGSYTFYLHEVEEKSKLLSAFTSGYNTSAPAGASKLRLAQLLHTVKYNVTEPGK